jgi:hypothetical protein
MKRRVLFFCILFLALFALQWGIRHPSVHNHIKQQIEDGMARIWDQEVRIGQMQPHLFPPAVILSDITGHGGTLRVREIRIVFGLRPTWPFLQISRIVVENPSVALTEPRLRNILEKKHPPSKLRVRTVHIKDGALDYRAVGQLQGIRLTGVQGFVYPGPTPRETRVDVTEAQGEITTVQARYPVDHLKGVALFHPHPIQVQDVTLVSGRSTLRAEGAFQGPEKGWALILNGQIPLEALLRTTLNGWHPSQGSYPSGILTVSGRLNGMPPDVTFEGDVALPHLFLDHREVGALRTHLIHRKGETRFSSAEGHLFSGTLTGEARIVGQPNTHDFQMRLNYKQIPLTETVRLLFRKEPPGIPTHVLMDGSVTFQTGTGGATAEGDIRGYRKGNGPSPTNGLDRLAALATEGSAFWKWSAPPPAPPRQGEGDGAFTFTQGQLSFPGAQVLLNGKWNRREGLQMETDLQATEIAAIAEALRIPATGALTLKGGLSVGPTDGDTPRFEGALSLDEWTLKGRQFGTAAATILYRDRLLAFQKGRIQAAQTRQSTMGGLASPPHWAKPNEPPPQTAKAMSYRFDGAIHLSTPPAFDFKTEVAAADPQDILTLFNLSVPLETTATGPLSIRGTPHAFSVDGPLTLGAGRLYGEPFQKGRLMLTVTQEAVSLKQVVLEGPAGIRLQGEGAIAYRGDYRIDARLAHAEKSKIFQSKLPRLSGDIALTVVGEGALKRPILKLVVDGKRLQYDTVQIGKADLIADFMEGEVLLDGQFQGKSRDESRKGSITGTVRLENPHPFSFQSHFSDVSLSPWIARPDTSVTVTGAVSGQGDFQQLDRARLTFSITDVAAKVQGYALRNDGPILIRAERGIYAIESADFIGENTQIAFQGGFTPLSRWDLYLQGEADLNLLPLLVPGVETARGVARLDLRVLDDWKRPRIQGEVSLSQGLIRTPLFPQAIYIASLSAIFNERVLLLETMRGRMGGGPFHAEGSADLSGWGLSKFGFQIGLDDVAVPLHPELSAVASGELLIQGDRQAQQVTGEITLKNAIYDKRVEVRPFIENLILRNEAERPSEPTGLDAVTLNVLLRGAENMRIDNNIARASLELDLSVKGTLRRPWLVGRVAIPEGHLYFQNNDFRIASGSVEFLTLDRIDPTFNIRADTTTRNAVDDQEYAIDLTLSGTLSQFTLDLTASPPLPEKDVLALLSGEATAFVVSEIFEGPIQKITGIDRIRIAPDDAQSGNARIIAEKRLLKDRLSVTYATPGSASEAPQIRMVYELSPRISLIGEQDEKGQKGGDIRFRFDFR